MEKHQFSTFSIDQHYFGVEVSKVQEVLRYQKMTRVPLSHPVISGLINLRGQIVTAIDLRTRIGLNQHTSNKPPSNIIIRHEDSSISLLVDEISDVIDLPPESFTQPLESLQGEARELIQGVYKLSNKLLLVLDIEKTVSISINRSI